MKGERKCINLMMDTDALCYITNIWCHSLLLVCGSVFPFCTSHHSLYISMFYP